MKGYSIYVAAAANALANVLPSLPLGLPSAPEHPASGRREPQDRNPFRLTLKDPVLESPSSANAALLPVPPPPLAP